MAPVVVKGRADPQVQVGGWGSTPLSQLPFQASVFTTEAMRDRNVQRLSDIVKLDPGVNDAYNTEGYYDALTIRGFVTDPRFNYQRDGLPINAETSIALDNKERIEILKGTSGVQSGTSAPGGLVNYVVKRPTDAPVRDVTLGWREKETFGLAVDIGQRFGTDNAFGLRVNAAAQQIRPKYNNADGERNLLAVAGDWRVTPGTLIELEVEHSHRSQPSVPGFSMLGDVVPKPGDPNLNLNNQPWSQPVVFDGDTASLRLTQKLTEQWSFTAHGATQRLTTQDRLAYPFGCGAESNYHRYCSDGTYDLYDYRSENERRRTDALELALNGRLQTFGIQHEASAGVLRTRVKNRFQDQTYQYAGTGNVDGTAVVPASPTPNYPNTNRDEHTTELFIRDAIRFNPRWTAWLGLRSTQLQRDSVYTDIAAPNLEPTSYKQTVNTPWLAGSFALSEATLLYASWGQGIESSVAPNRPSYTNAGQAMAASKSRQTEVGIKGVQDRIDWRLAVFDITRPAYYSGAGCDSSVIGSCTLQRDGNARHTGVEASTDWRTGPWQLGGGLQYLRARREDSAQIDVDGKRPTNVPAATLKLQAKYTVPALPALSVRADFQAETSREVTPDNSAEVPGYGRVDTSLRYQQKLQDGSALVWRAGVDNLFNKRAWRESAYQFDHVYLFPLQERTFFVTVEASL